MTSDDYFESRYLKSILASGDRVAVFTGKLYETLAHHGVVVSPTPDGYGASLIYIPSIDSYCMVDEEALLKLNDGSTGRAAFAQITFNQFDATRITGSYRRFLGAESCFSVVQSDDGGFGFDIAAPVTNTGIETWALTVRVPSLADLDEIKCLNLLRQILALDYATAKTNGDQSAAE